MKSGFIAIVGRPNVGKSTLMNALLGSKLSIVTPKAQTTRERVLGILTDPAKGQIVFVDTPGVHRAKEGGINESMVHEAREALDGPTLVWYLVDPNSALHHEQPVIELLAAEKDLVVTLIFNKIDLKLPGTRPEALERFEKEIREALLAKGVRLAGVRRISAYKNKGTDGLLKEGWERLPEGPLYYPDPDALSDRPMRFFVGEKVREQLYLQLGDELPYSCAVEIENFDESQEKPRIEAIIHVERDSQKGIVIGKGGQKIKEIGTAARKEVEELLGLSVFLGLRVKVYKDWTRDADALKKLGYHLPDRRS